MPPGEYNEKDKAMRAALLELYAKYPDAIAERNAAIKYNFGDSWKQRLRATEKWKLQALSYPREAVHYLRYSGIPEEDVIALGALIYG